ncbi:MAG TPA: DUF6629 family protein [Myxococcota bacterium]|nr:DUF6629 family protein [Myxococcota bacterium]
MCFSAEASFAASAVLGAGGVWTLSLAPTPAERPLAAIPVIFAVQQFFEGVVWVGVAHEQATIVAVFSYVFSFFALFLWPIYTPLAVLRVESHPRRRRILEALVVVGICAAVAICGFMTHSPLETHVMRGHLCYHLDGLPYELIGLYFVAVSAPCFSSHGWLRAFGAALMAALAVSLGMYEIEFVSVWCFFAAVMSALLLLHMNHVGKALRTPAPA